MNIRCGIDIIELERVDKALSRFGDRFKNKIFTEAERQYCESMGKASLNSYAARFSAKEAVSKALGTGISKGVSFLDIEILKDDNGKPFVVLHNEAKKVFDKIGGTSIDISLSHSRYYATAQAVILIK